MMFPRFGAKLVFANYNVWSIRIRVFLDACNLWQDVIANPEKCISKKVREMKEKRTRKILQGVMHEEVWKHVMSFDSLSQLWNELEFICNNYKGPSLPKESWFLEEDEKLVEEIDEVEEEEESKNEDFEDICRKAKEIDHDENREFENTIKEAYFENGEEKESVKEIVEIEKIEEEFFDEDKEYDIELKPPSQYLEIPKESNDAFSHGSWVQMGSSEKDTRIYEKPNLEGYLVETNEYHIQKQSLTKRELSDTSNSFCDSNTNSQEVDHKLDQHEKDEKKEFENLEEHEKNILSIKSNDLGFRVMNFVEDIEWVTIEKYFDQREFVNSKMEKQHKKFMKHAKCEKLVSKIKTQKVYVEACVKKKCQDTKVKKRMKIFTSKEMAKEFLAFEGIGRSKGFTTL